MQRPMSLLRLFMAGSGLLVAGALPAMAQSAVQGTWVATKAETNGMASADVVGRQLLVLGRRFEIRSKDGTSLYGGLLEFGKQSAPSAIDFRHTAGNVVGKWWRGIYKVEGDTLTIADNAADMKKRRPRAFESKPASGHVVVTFVRMK